MNDTVIGDPLLTVPINVPNITAFGYDDVSLCYEIHGEANTIFNLVTDACISVSAHYINITADLNIINQIGIRAVDKDGQCKNIQVDLEECRVSINGGELTNAKYFSAGLMVRKGGRQGDRVRVRVPNCNELPVVMYIICQRDADLENTLIGDMVKADMIKFEVTRGLNVGHSNAHGLIGESVCYTILFTVDSVLLSYE